MSSQIIKYSDIEIDKLDIDHPLKKTSYYYGLVKYNNENNLFLQVDENKFIDFKDGSIPYIEVKIDEKFKDFLLKIDDRCIDIVDLNKVDWFHKDIPKEIIQEMYKNIITKTNANNIRIRLPKLKDNIICKIYDNERLRLNVMELKKDEKISCIINFKGIKITKKTVLFDLCMNQIKVYRENIPKNISDKCIVDDDEVPDDYIDEIELEESYIRDKIKMLSSQKQEDIQMINQLNMRIKNIESEIKQLKYIITY